MRSSAKILAAALVAVMLAVLASNAMADTLVSGGNGQQVTQSCSRSGDIKSGGTEIQGGESRGCQPGKHHHKHHGKHKHH